MGWWHIALFVEPLAPELSAEDIVKQTQTVVRAYSCLVAESGTNLPEEAQLP